MMNGAIQSVLLPARRLVALLEDPQPGLSSWNHFYAKAMQELSDIWNSGARPKRVVVEVSGGVAEATEVPEGVEVEIVDHDDLEAEEERKKKGQS